MYLFLNLGILMFFADMLLHIVDFSQFDTLEDIVTYLIRENRLHNEDVKFDITFNKKARGFLADKLGYSKDDEIGRYLNGEIEIKPWFLAAVGYVLNLAVDSFLALCFWYGFSENIFKRDRNNFYLALFDFDAKRREIYEVNAEIAKKNFYYAKHHMKQIHMLGRNMPNDK